MSGVVGWEVMTRLTDEKRIARYSPPSIHFYIEQVLEICHKITMLVTQITDGGRRR